MGSQELILWVWVCVCVCVSCLFVCARGTRVEEGDEQPPWAKERVWCLDTRQWASQIEGRAGNRQCRQRWPTSPRHTAAVPVSVIPRHQGAPPRWCNGTALSVRTCPWTFGPLGNPLIRLWLTSNWLILTSGRVECSEGCSRKSSRNVEPACQLDSFSYSLVHVPSHSHSV